MSDGSCFSLRDRVKAIPRARFSGDSVNQIKPMASIMQEQAAIEREQIDAICEKIVVLQTKQYHVN